VHEYASGPAVVRVDGRRTLAAAFPGTVEVVEAQPGQHVKQGDVLVRFRDVEQAAELRRVSTEFELQLLRLLREPTDHGAKQLLTGLKVQRDLAKTVADERSIRAPSDGIVSDIRIHPGQHLTPGEPILGLSPADAKVYVVAVVPGDYRPMVKQGLGVRFSLDGYRYEYRDLVVEAVGEEVVGPTEIKRFLGQEIYDSVHLPPGSYVLVRAALPDTTFRSEGAQYGYFDGLTGLAEIRVRSESLLVTLIPALKAIVP
jgi:membrane fusion protein (multidrug efflux system)